VLFQTVSRSRVASLSRLTYKRIASHVHIKTAVNPSIEIRRKLRYMLHVSMLPDRTHTKRPAYPQFLRFANASHVVLVCDCARLVRPCRVFQVHLDLILAVRHSRGGLSVCHPVRQSGKRDQAVERSRKKTSCHGSRQLYKLTKPESTWIKDIQDSGGSNQIGRPVLPKTFVMASGLCRITRQSGIASIERRPDLTRISGIGWAASPVGRRPEGQSKRSARAGWQGCMNVCCVQLLCDIV